MTFRRSLLLRLCVCQYLILEHDVVVAFVGSRTATFLCSATKTPSTRMWSTTKTATTASTDEDVASLKENLVEMMRTTDLGRVATDEQRHEIEQGMQHLEGFCSMKAPTRSNLTNGAWNSLYSTAPPPSNGELGPFKGEAQQVIDMEKHTYQNILLVPPNNWLTATLDASYEEWDGVLLDQEQGKQQQQQDVLASASTSAMPSSKQNDKDDDDDVLTDDSDEVPPQSLLLDTVSPWFSGVTKGTPTHIPVHLDVNYGATCWKVTFQRLTITLFGKFNVFVKDFDSGTQRIWRTTYLDHDTRIVRAGKTGQRGDEMVFYMTRAKENQNN